MNFENQQNLNFLSNKGKKEDTLIEKLYLKSLEKIGQSIGLKFGSNIGNDLLNIDKNPEKSLNKLISVRQLIDPSPRSKFDPSSSQRLFFVRNTPSPKTTEYELSPISVQQFVFPKPGCSNIKKPQVISDPKFIPTEKSTFYKYNRDFEIKTLSVINSAKPLPANSPQFKSKKKGSPEVSNFQRDKVIKEPIIAPLKKLEKSKPSLKKLVLPALSPKNKEKDSSKQVKQEKKSQSIDLRGWD